MSTPKEAKGHHQGFSKKTVHPQGPDGAPGGFKRKMSNARHFSIRDPQIWGSMGVWRGDAPHKTSGVWVGPNKDYDFFFLFLFVYFQLLFWIRSF